MRGRLYICERERHSADSAASSRLLTLQSRVFGSQPVVANKTMMCQWDRVEFMNLVKLAKEGKLVISESSKKSNSTSGDMDDALLQVLLLLDKFKKF